MTSPRRGYTMVELAVTITLVGIVALLAIPTFRVFQERAAREAADVAFNRTVAQAQALVSGAFASQAAASDAVRFTDLSRAASDTSSNDGDPVLAVNLDLPGSPNSGSARLQNDSGGYTCFTYFAYASQSLAATTCTTDVLPPVFFAAPAVIAGPVNSGYVDVQWAPPADPGSLAIVNYLVACRADSDPVPANGTGTVTVLSTDLSARVAGLANGYWYDCTVTALTAGGGGSLPSVPGRDWLGSTSTPVPPGYTPTELPAPTNFVCSPQNQSAVCTWTQVESSVTAPVAGYKVYVNGSLVTTLTGNVGTFTLSNLQNGTTYSSYVTSYGSGTVESPASNLSDFTPVGAPAAPSGVTCTVNDTGATVRAECTWPAVASTAAAPVTGYIVKIDGSVKPTQVANGFVVDPVEYGRQYVIEVQSTGPGGTSTAFSYPFTPDYPAPGGVQTDSQAVSEVTVQWNWPTFTG